MINNKVPRSTRLRRVVAAAAGSLLLLGACANQDTTTEPEPGGSAAAQPLAGKRVLVTPYWLDNFNTANANWVKRLLEEQGARVDVNDPQAVASKQLNILETAMSSQNYDVIIWQPVDSNTAKTLTGRIKAAGIGQVVDFAGFAPTAELPFSAVTGDFSQQSRPMGVAAGEYIKAHPELGEPAIAFVNSEPANVICDDRGRGLLEGVQSVMPEAKVVYDQGAKDAAAATDNVTDLITRGTQFNIFMGCGGSVSIGGLSALKSAGLAGAPNKEPDKVYMVTIDATPPELEALWSKDSNVMRTSFYGAKTVAEDMVKQATDLMTGVVSIDTPVEAFTKTTILTPDCTKGRELILTQYEGVKGFTVPECSFTFEGDSKTYEEINDK